MGDNYAPIFTATVAGYPIPASEISVEQTTYGVADLIRARTYAWGNQDWGRISQKFMPCTFKVNGGADRDSLTQLIEGVLDQIDCVAEDDEVELQGRGVLSLLIDKRVSIKPLQNTTISNAITKLIQSVGLTPLVTDSSIMVGAEFNDKNFGMNRNTRILDVIQSMAFGAGFRIRVQGRTVIVGPPPDKSAVYVMKRRWGSGQQSGEHMKIEHSALHARNVHVKVVSYIQATKQKASSTNTVLSPLAASMGMPTPINSSAGTKGTRGGRISSSTVGDAENPNRQEYIINGYNKSQADIEKMRQNLETDISRREFRLNYKFSPTPDELTRLLKASPEFLIELSGCPMPSNDGVYHPEKVTWKWEVGTDAQGGENIGLTLEVEALNHDIPQPSAGLPNT